jgi:putative sterol carrier protein
MPRFPSEEWIKAFADELNNSPEYAEANKDWEGDVCYVVLPDGPIKEPVYFYVDVWHGHVRDAYMSREPIKTAFVISAPFSVWRKLIEGKLHPIPAMAKQQIKVEGNLIKLMRISKGVQATFECVIRVPTEFPE